MLRVVLVLCATLVASQAMQLTTYSDCGSKAGTVNSINVQGCNSEPCLVHKGSTYHINVNFTATATSQEAHNSLAGIIAGLELPFPVTPANECRDGMQCPINAGEKRVYSVSLECPFFAPSMKLVSKWRLKDENQRDILCFVIPLQIA